MRQEITGSKISLSEREAKELRNEFVKVTDGNLELYPDKYPQMNVLFKLLTSAYDSSIHNVHMISKREAG